MNRTQKLLKKATGKKWNPVPKLLPCPFCGKREHKIGGGRKYGITIRCGWCGARGPTAGEHWDARAYWNDRGLCPSIRHKGAKKVELSELSDFDIRHYGPNA